MRKPIRILQVFARMDLGGAESMIMDIYRNSDQIKIQFDFVVHTIEKCIFDDETYSLGGNIFRVPRYTGKNHSEYKSSWKKTLKKIQDIKLYMAMYGAQLQSI